MTEHNFSVYNAFSSSPFGGCAAGIVDQAADLKESEMLRIAREVGAPATCFITANSGKIIRTRFFSPLTEYPMCGHAAIALGAWLRDNQFVAFDESRIASIRLKTPHAFADIKVQQSSDEDLEVFLTLPPAEFSPASVSDDEIASVLDIDPCKLDSDLERALTVTDFRTLLVPMKHLSDLELIVPDANKIRAFCSQTKLDTIFVFTPQPRVAPGRKLVDERLWVHAAPLFLNHQFPLVKSYMTTDFLKIVDLFPTLQLHQNTLGTILVPSQRS